MANAVNQRPIVHAALFVALSYVLLFIVLPIAGLAFIAYIFASVFKSVSVAPAPAPAAREPVQVVRAPVAAAPVAAAPAPVSVAGQAAPVQLVPVVSEFTDFSGSEPEWMKKIPNWLICDWFYFFFIVNVVVVVTLMISIVVTAMSSSLPKTVRASQLFMMITHMLASGTSTLFFYVMCDRALKP
jgi:hypothetical protein